MTSLNLFSMTSLTPPRWHHQPLLNDVTNPSSMTSLTLDDVTARGGQPLSDVTNWPSDVTYLPSDITLHEAANHGVMSLTFTLLLWCYCYDVTNPSTMTSLISLLWRHNPSTMTSLIILLWRHNPSTMTSFYYDITTLYYDGTYPSTVTSLAPLLWRH